MRTWKCVFNEATLIGSGCNREAGPGEISRDLNPVDCGLFCVTPGRYMLVDEVLVERPEWAAEKAAENDARDSAIAALQSRIAAIESAREAEGLKQYTVEQANAWIVNKLTSAPNTVAGVKQAVGEILQKMIPYVLP